MRKVLMILAACASLTLAQSTTASYSYGGLPIRILPNSYGAWSYASVFVPKSLAITSVTVGVQVAYNGVSDLNVYLYSPAGTRTKLLERNCSGLQNINTTFDDAAPTRFASFCPTEAGRGPYSGNEPLSNSKGENSLGYWKLGVENNGSENTGTLDAVTITVTGTPTGTATIGPGTIVSATSYKTGAVAPSDIVAVFGANLGPTPGVQAPAGNLPTSISLTSVTFDGIVAPLYYVSAELVIAQAPKGLTPLATTKIQVHAPAGASAQVPVSVVPSRPGIFTYQAGPTGQAKAINQDGSLNGDGTVTVAGTDKPAAAGTTIQLFASGLGPVNPAIADGAVAGSNPLSVATLPVTATISGVPAAVTYAGAAPGLVGTYQVNVVIPNIIPSGSATIVLTSGGNSSQDGATIQIK